MNLAVDIGNTFTKVGCFERDIFSSKRVFNNDDELKEFLSSANSENIIISSVKTDFNDFKPGVGNKAIIYFTNATPVPIKKNYNSPETLGADRLAASVGAFQLFPGSNCLTIDMGTCITYDIVNEEGVYLGGAISPGIAMKFKALHNFTSRLPLIEPEGDISIIGKDTKGSILSGVINGTSSEVEHMIQKYSEIFNNLQVLICGGDAKFFETRIKAPIFVIPELVLIGLNRILQHNVSS